MLQCGRGLKAEHRGFIWSKSEMAARPPGADATLDVGHQSPGEVSVLK